MKRKKKNQLHLRLPWFVQAEDQDAFSEVALKLKNPFSYDVHCSVTPSNPIFDPITTKNPTQNHIQFENLPDFRQIGFFPLPAPASLPHRPASFLLTITVLLTRSPSQYVYHRCFGNFEHQDLLSLFGCCYHKLFKKCFFFPSPLIIF